MTLLFVLGLAGKSSGEAVLDVNEEPNDYYTITAYNSGDPNTEYWVLKVDVQSGGIFSFKDLTDAGDGGGDHTDYCDDEAYNRQATLAFFDGRGGNVFTRNNPLADLADRLTFTEGGGGSSFTIKYEETSSNTDFYHDSYSDGDRTLYPGDLLTTIEFVIKPPTENGTFWDWTADYENVSSHDLSAKIWAADFLFMYIWDDISNTSSYDESLIDETWDPCDPDSYIRFTIDSNPSLGLTQGREFVFDRQVGLAAGEAGGTVTVSNWAGFDYLRHTAGFDYDAEDALEPNGIRTDSGQYIINITGETDTTAPSPDPMTWATDPYATGDSSISMTATTATDGSGVEYYFDCTAGGGNDSGWQDGTTYEDTGLSPSTQYTYQVKARDKSGNQNETAYSTTKSATTSADGTSPSPDPMTWATVPYATGTTSISMTATTAGDPCGVEYFFDCTAGGGNDSSWQDGTTYEDTGLDPNTEYTYQVKARDKSAAQNETAYSTTKSATTDSDEDTTPPSPDPMTWSIVPHATGGSSISMTATTATDPCGVEYYFDCTAGGGNDSGWQDDTTYEDTGLSEATQYTYQVKARDKSANQNETGYSTTKSATTDDVTAPSPDPMTWATEPYATGISSISMTTTTATDVSGVQYYFDCTAGGGSDSSWQAGTTYEDTGLDPNTQYTYKVKARDNSSNQNETAYSTTKSATTDNSVTSTSSWQNFAIETQTGSFTFEFDATANGNNIDVCIGTASGEVSGWGDLATTVRFFTDGYFDARDGSVYTADANVAYSSGNTYHIRMDVNVPSHIYDVYITPPGESEVALGSDYAFRTGTEGVTKQDHWAFTHTIASVTISNIEITRAPQPKATVPSPADQAVDVPVTVDLSWTPGDYASSHDVYLGTDYNSVADANHSSAEFMGNYDTNSYDPNSLSKETIYYWAVDEVNDTNSNVWYGDVWIFTTLENQSPVAFAGYNQEVIDADANSSETVVLHGSAYDNDGTISSYVWKEDSNQIATGTDPNVTLDLGEHIITLEATDNDSATGTDVVVVTVSSPGSGTTYYIDYDSGSDDSNGLSPSTAFKHCPGDTEATSTAASTTLSGGDTVVFKSGVRYRGTVTCNWSGSSGSEIIYGTFGGNGPAIIDGAEEITGWTQCTSSGDCGGNPNWQNIYYTSIPDGTDPYIANMYEDDQMIWPCQDPNLVDPFYLDDLSTYVPIHSSYVTQTSVTDANYFTQSNANYWDGCYILIWGNPNIVRVQKVTGYIPAQNKLEFEDTGANSLYSDKTVYYSMGNRILHIDTPGEFHVDEVNDVVYLWPRTGGDISQKEITRSTRKVGFNINGKSYISVRGLKIQKQASGFGEYHSGVAVLDRFGGDYNVVRNNAMTMNRSMEKQGVIRMYGGCTNITIEDNSVYENPRNRGMILTFQDSTCRNNYMRKNGGTAIDFYGCVDSNMIGNTVVDHTGVHANGLTLYLDCINCEVAYNLVYNGNCALTTQDATSITVAYNILHTNNDAYCVADWHGGEHISSNLHYYNNVIMQPDNAALSTGGEGLIVKNNIIDGALVDDANEWDGFSYNIYTSLAWVQDSAYGWSLGTGEMLVEDRSLLFVDAENADYHLIDLHPVADSNAIDAGTGVGYDEDLDGNPVPTGSGVDIGIYEYITEANDTTAPSPDPMTWATDPYATGPTSISMTATTATDASGVEYYFKCTAGGGNDSAWQDGTTYEDTGLSELTQYTYRVKARDKSSNQNETAYSTTKSATTEDGTAPTPDPMTWATDPYATGSTSISMTATTATDTSGVEYFFDCTAGGGNDSGWQDGTTYEDTGLSPSTQYTYQVKARDKSSNQNETAYSTTKSATTDPAPQWTQLTYDDFETGWGSYTDGGGDCSRYTDGTYAHQGSCAIDIQDNSGVSSSFYYTNGVDVNTPGYSQIKVEFWYYPNSMESGEDFWVQYYDGTDLQTVATFVSGTDFSNGSFFEVKDSDIVIDSSTYNFPTNMKIRFMCDAGNNNDDVYIDEVKVSAE